MSAYYLLGGNVDGNCLLGLDAGWPCKRIAHSAWYESSPYKQTFPDHRPQEENLEIARIKRKLRGK